MFRWLFCRAASGFFATAMLLLLLSGCNPVTTYKYVLRNSSSYPLEATYSTFAFRDSVVQLSAESEITIYEYQRLGKIHDNQERFELEMKMLQISFRDNLLYIQNPVQRRFWESGSKKSFNGGGVLRYVLLIDAALLGLPGI